MFVHEMDLAEAQRIVSAMAEERGTRGHVIIQEYLKYRQADTLACAHFWPNQNSACYKIVTELDKLDEAIA